MTGLTPQRCRQRIKGTLVGPVASASVGILVLLIVLGPAPAIGAFIGYRRDRPVFGLLLGLVLSWLGVLMIATVRPKPPGVTQ